jgi:transposase
VRKRCSRKQLHVYTANLRVGRIGMEPCAGAHFLGRALREQGHDVRLMPAQYVKSGSGSVSNSVPLTRAETC